MLQKESKKPCNMQNFSQHGRCKTDFLYVRFLFFNNLVFYNIIALLFLLAFVDLSYGLDLKSICLNIQMILL